MLPLMIGIGAIFAAIVLTVVTLLSASTGRAGVAKALETIDTVYAPGSVSPAEENLRHRLAPAVAGVAEIGRRLTPKGATAWLQRWLDYAGKPTAWPPERVVEMQGICLLLFAAVFGAFAFALDFSVASVFITVLIGAFLGFWTPFMIIYDMGVRRQQQIGRQMPDALDLLTLSVEAGLGFDAAMAQVATAMPGALAREFARVLQEMQMGQRRADAMRAMGARTTVVQLRTFASSITQAGELGIPIAAVLREQAHQMRLVRRQRAEEQARKLPVKVIFPLIFCLFPVLFIVVIGPGVINIMKSFGAM